VHKAPPHVANVFHDRIDMALTCIRNSESFRSNEECSGPLNVGRMEINGATVLKTEAGVFNPALQKIGITDELGHEA
jgi:hypothetical protein